MSATEVRKARRLEVEYLNKMKVVERVPYSFIKHRTGKEPIKVRWVDTLKTSGIHRGRLVAKEFPPRVQNLWLHEIVSAPAT